MQQQRSGQARAVLTEVQNRHDDMKKIEKTIIVSCLGVVV
jgi:syntaxin 1B/2/3